jgi:hypothetical protein
MILEPFITARNSSFLCSENIGLGNVLFQIASVYGLAKKYPLKAYFNTVVNYCNILKTRFDIDLSKTVLRNFQTIMPIDISQIEIMRLECGTNYDRETQKILECIHTFLENPTKHCIIYAYFENINYFHDYYDEIKSLFSPTELCLKSLRLLLPKLYDTSITPVSIHFRYLWNTVGNDYYKRAVEYIKAHVPNPHFFLFCDTSSAEKLNEIGFEEGDYTQVKLRNDEIDLELYAIGECAHHIVSKSTFCFWGVYLNRNPSKIVIKSNTMPMTWYGDCISL